MSTERGCHHAEQAVGWTLHALEPADEGVLNEHLPTCQVCQELVRQTQDVVRGLVATSEQRNPPARLREGLVRAVAVTPQLPPAARERPWSVGAPGSAVPAEHSAEGWEPRPPPDHDRPIRGSATSPGSSRPHGRRRLIAVAATIAVAFVGVGGVTMELVERARQSQESALAAPSPEANRVLSDLDRTGAEHALLRSPSGQVLAAVAVFPTERQVMPIGLPANAADRTVYILWGLGDGPPTPVGAFDVGSPSETLLSVGASAGAGQFPSYAISIENGRTAPASPGLVVASGQVAS